MPSKKRATPVSLQPLDALFGTNEETTNGISEIAIGSLHPFTNHPFQVRDDKKMEELAESITQYGVLVPGIVRLRESGGYELVAGHRRKRACELSGLEKMPVIIKDLTDDEVSLMGFEHVVSCLCECEVKARQELDEKMQREEEQRQLYQRKSVGLRERRFWEWKFENDNGSNQKILIARQYVENWTDMKRKNVGLLLMGPVGTGKSFFAGCIANALLEQGERVMMTNFSRILNEMTSYQADKNQIIQNLVDYPLLIIDDLGIERNSEFALEQVYNVIDSRYCKMLPLIVTTNLGLNEMKSTDLDTAHQRIYSRILEMCVPIYCGGEDKRKEEGTEKLVQVQNLITG